MAETDPEHSFDPRLARGSAAGTYSIPKGWRGWTEGVPDPGDRPPVRRLDPSKADNRLKDKEIA
jgi:hypothetical protein